MGRTPRVAVLVALGAVIALGGCGPTAREIASREQREQHAARERKAQEREAQERHDAFRRDVAELHRTCCPAATTHAEAAREHQRRYRALTATYGQPIDAYQDAEMAYVVAISERVDRGELSRAQAEAAIAEIHLRLKQERDRQAAEQRRERAEELERLSRMTLGLLQQQQAQQQAEAARLDAWNQFWLNLSLIQLLQRPVQCSTSYVGSIPRTTCY